MAEESKIEKKFKDIMQDTGWRAFKLSCPGFDGMPDRIILKPGGRVFFAEIKAPGEKPRALQVVRSNMLEKMGFRVYVVDSFSDIEAVRHEELTMTALFGE